MLAKSSMPTVSNMLENLIVQEVHKQLDQLFRWKIEPELQRIRNNFERDLELLSNSATWDGEEIRPWADWVPSKNAQK